MRRMIFIRLLCVTLLTLGLLSCQKSNNSDYEGELQILGIVVDNHANDQEILPKRQEFVLDIFNALGEVIEHYPANTKIPLTVKLPAGEYTIRAYCIAGYYSMARYKHYAEEQFVIVGGSPTPLLLTTNSSAIPYYSSYSKLDTTSWSFNYYTP